MATASKTPPGADPKQLERTGTIQEIGSQAVWSLSSCKPGFGVDKLRDDNIETYWQSDGSQPHLVNIQFRAKTTVNMLCMYADFKSDKSYTPCKISVRVGNNFHNLQEIRMAAAFQWYDNLRGWLIGVNPTTPAEGIIVPFKCAPTVIERTFGILKMLFRCLDVCGGTLQYTPQKKLELVDPSGWIHIPLLDIINNPIQTFMIQIALLSNHQNGKDTHMRQIKVYTPVEESSIGKFRRCTTLDFMMYRTIR